MVKGAHKRNLQNTENHNKAACERKEEEKSKRLIEVFHKTRHRFVPKLSKWIALIEDPRQKNKTKYNIEHLLWIGIFLFLILCDKYGWKYIITFKEGSMPDMFRWWKRMKEIGSVEKARITRGKNTQKFVWINNLPYIRPPFKEVTAKLNILEYRETEKDLSKKFVKKQQNFAEILRTEVQRSGKRN